MTHLRKIILLFISAVLGYLIYAFFGSFTKPIKTIKSFTQVNFNSIQKDTLVIFDADETLIQPTDSYYVNEFSGPAIGFKRDLIKQHPEITDWDEYADITIRQVQRPLIEPMIIQQIDALQKRGIPVIVCTAIKTGKYGKMQRLEQWRYEHLKSLGFQGSFADLIIDFPAHGSRHPVFYKGILATDQLWKGPIIAEFLDHMQLKPARIIMFDDMQKELESVQQECKKRNIEFQGYEYKGAKSKPWNEELIKFQTDYLLKNKKWLSDEEAHLKMIR